MQLHHALANESVRNCIYVSDDYAYTEGGFKSSYVLGSRVGLDCSGQLMHRWSAAPNLLVNSDATMRPLIAPGP